MSLPEFPKPDTILSRDQALDAILTSIAMEEVALSHIINAEGEKIQYILKSARANKADVCDVLKVNESATALLEQVNDMQMTLKNKLRWALKYLPKPEEPPCPKPKPPHPEPKPPCPRPKSPCTCSYQESRPPWLGSKPSCSRPRPSCSCQELRSCSCQKDSFPIFFC